MGAGASATDVKAGISSASAEEIRAVVEALPEDKRAAVLTAMAAATAKPKVLFVLGGPGAGKGTQCARIVSSFTHWAHISAGDCLRAERNNPESKEGELINSIIKEGKLVPSEITASLLEKEMTKLKGEGKTCFLIDGFPRSVGNVDAWQATVGDRADVLGVLFYTATDEELEKRCLARGATSGRVDDNIESIKKRFKTYMDETMPVVDSSRYQVFKIDGMPPEEEVWKVTSATIKAVEAKPNVLFVLGGPGAGKGTQCAKIIENFKHWAHISAGDCLRAERNNPDSKEGELINNIIKEGKLVPSEITVALLAKAMASQKAEGKTSFLIDGFPRSIGNVNSWVEVVGDNAKVLGVLFYDANEDEMEKRCVARGATSGRVDDNIESIKKRFKTYMEETMPIVESGRYEVFKIDGLPPAEEVWKVTQEIVTKAEAKALG